MTIKLLAQKGHQKRQIARMLGVSEGTVRYHLRQLVAGAEDGRARQPFRAAEVSGAIAHYLESLDDGDPVNLAVLHEYLVTEHGYEGSLRSVQRYFRANFPRPRRRARRRFESPPGAQAQADWDVFHDLHVGGRRIRVYRFHMTLSWSRRGVTVWSPRKDQLSWLSVHNDSFRRLGGVPATVRVDNEKTAAARGAGPWGELNPSYRRYARALRFHIDLCLPAHPEGKGKVERHVLTHQRADDVRRRRWSSFDELQEYAREQDEALARRRICPATGTPVLEAWREELPYLSPLPILPDPFDLVASRRVQRDCTVAFEGRRYSVPFALLGRSVEVRGCARTVQVLHDGGVVAEHPRRTRELIVIDPRHYEGEATDEVLPPLPLGRMGRRLQEIGAMAPQQRPLDLYAALAEVAR